MLSCILFFNLAGCDDKDYSDDIDALKKELAETQASIKTLQDLTNALQNQLSINSYEKTDNGYILKMSNGNDIVVTKGEDGTDAPIITDIIESENSMEFVFSDGNIITLPKNEKYDVISFTIEVLSSEEFEFSFTSNSSNYFGDHPNFPFPEDLEINWGDGQKSGRPIHWYEKTGTYTITTKARQIHALTINSHHPSIKSINIEKSHHLKYLKIARLEGEITISNSTSLLVIDYFDNVNTTILNLENLSSLKYISVYTMMGNGKLQALNITNCPEIEIIECTSPILTNLNLEKLPNLNELTCGEQLAELDISKNTNLRKLHCYGRTSTIWVWEGFNPANYSNWSIPEGAEYKIKQ